MPIKVKTDGAEFHEQMAKDIPSFYPWQYKNFNVQDIVMIPIEPDIKLYWNEKSLYRKGYEVDNENKLIKIPHFFIKINGRHKEDKEYIEFVKFLTESKNTIVYDDYFYKHPTTNYTTGINNSEEIKFKKILEEQTFLKKEEKESLTYQYIDYILKSEKIRNCSFNNLIKEKQIQIIRILSNYIEKDMENMTVKLFDRLLNNILSIPENIIILLNNFDYGLDIPKIIFENCNFTEDSAFLIKLLSRIGIDIIILETSGKPTIEKYIEIDSISLGYFEQNYNINEKSMTKKEKILKAISLIDIDKLIPFIYWAYYVITAVLMIILLFTASGKTNTILEILFGVLFVIFTIIVSNLDLVEIGYDDGPTVAVIIYVIAVIVILIGRGLFSIDIQSEKTITYTGTLNSANYILDTKNEYIIESNKDAVGIPGERKLYLYLDNNEVNEISVYFKILNGTNTIYTSTKISPYEYITNVMLDSGLSSDCEKLTIQYYEYDEQTGKKYEMLGSEEINVHLARDDDELKELLKEYKLE